MTDGFAATKCVHDVHRLRAQARAELLADLRAKVEALPPAGRPKVNWVRRAAVLALLASPIPEPPK